MAANTLRYRHELKYLISESQAAGIARYIAPLTRWDKHSESKPRNAYTINSLYLDSDDLRLCQESLTGKATRMKLRIRSYSDKPGSPCFFEIKRRINRLILKSRATVIDHQLEGLLTDHATLPNDSSAETRALKQFCLYKSNLQAKPMVRVRYQRQAREGIGSDPMRITFDRHLGFKTTQSINIHSNGPGWQRMPLNNGVVLEIKFTGSYPSWIHDLTRHFGLRDQSFSKYALSMQQADLLGFCAPQQTQPLKRKIFASQSRIVSVPDQAPTLRPKTVKPYQITEFSPTKPEKHQEQFTR